MAFGLDYFQSEQERRAREELALRQQILNQQDGQVQALLGAPPEGYRERPMSSLEMLDAAGAAQGQRRREMLAPGTQAHVDPHADWAAQQLGEDPPGAPTLRTPQRGRSTTADPFEGQQKTEGEKGFLSKLRERFTGGEKDDKKDDGKEESEEERRRRRRKEAGRLLRQGTF